MNAFVDAAVILLLFGLAAGAPEPGAGLLVALPAAAWLALVTPTLVRSDVERRRLPNALTLPAVGLVLVGVATAWALREGGRDPAIAVAVVIGVALLGVFGAARGGIGLGDVKLCAALAGSIALIDVGAFPVFAGVSGLAGLIASAFAWRRARVPVEGPRGRDDGVRAPQQAGPALPSSDLLPRGRRRPAPRCATPVTSGLGSTWWPEATWRYDDDPAWADDDGRESDTPQESENWRDWLRRVGHDADATQWSKGLDSEVPGVGPVDDWRGALETWRAWQYEDLRVDLESRVAPPVVPLRQMNPKGTGSRHLGRQDPRATTIAYGPCLLAGYWTGLVAVQVPGWLESGWPGAVVLGLAGAGAA